MEEEQEGQGQGQGQGLAEEQQPPPQSTQHQSSTVQASPQIAMSTETEPSTFVESPVEATRPSEGSQLTSSVPCPPSGQSAQSPASSGRQNQVLDKFIRLGDISPPPLSSSDVLMSSFKVLEGRDPVPNYEVQAPCTVLGPHAPSQHVYPTSSTAGASWPAGRLEHNTNSILRSLKEPISAVENQEPVFQTRSHQAIYTTDDTSHQRMTTSGVPAEWPDYENENSLQNRHHYTQSPPTPTVQDLSRSSYIQKRRTGSASTEKSFADTTSQGTLTRAVKETFSIAHFSCTHCMEKFRIPEKLAEHVKTVHSGSIVYTCFTCGRKFFNPHDLREHVASHASDPIKCSLCTLVLSSSKELRNHHKKSHPMSAISCSLCDKIFASNAARAKHLVLEHKNDSRVTLCDLCGEVFLDKAMFTEHMKSHDTSGIANRSSARHEQTISQKPTTVIIWKCDKCGHIFANDKELTKHKESMHRDNIRAKSIIVQTIRNNNIEGKPEFLKTAQSELRSSRYELLRLLLARRKASSSLNNTEIPSSVAQELTSKEYLGGKPVASDEGIHQKHIEHHQQGAPDFDRGPAILSAEAMQHVADELSLIEQTMDNKKRHLDTFLSTKSLPVTADMMMEGESTIGINLAIKKNTSQDMNLQEIHKQKTLINRLQGTVASIIEKEVKHTRPPEKITWNNMAQVNVRDVSNDHYHNKQHSDSKLVYYMKEVNGKPTENNNVIYENKNYYTSFPSENETMDATCVTTGLPCMAPPVTLQANSYSSAPIASDLRQAHGFSEEHCNTERQTGGVNKCTSPWDDHIESLLNLFQNVGSSHLDKQQKQPYDNAQYLLPQFSENNLQTENILDLSNSHQNTYPSVHDNDIQHKTIQVEEQSRSPKLPSFNSLAAANRGLRNSLRFNENAANSTTQTSAQLPHFNDIEWSKMKHVSDSRDSPSQQMQTTTVPNDYKEFLYSSSNLNQMSGGKFHYAPIKDQQKEDMYYTQHTDINHGQEGLSPESIMVVQAENKQHEQHQHMLQQHYEEIPQHEVHYHTQQVQQEQDVQVQFSRELHHGQHEIMNYSSFASDGQLDCEASHLGMSRLQQSSFTPSPTEDEVSQSSYTDLTPVQLPIHANQPPALLPPVQNIQCQPPLDQVQVPHNYTPNLKQTPYSPEQQQLPQRHYAMPPPVPQYEQTNTKQTIEKGYATPGFGTANRKVTDAITHYLNGKHISLAKKVIPEVPMVFRHKLLASILKDDDGKVAAPSGVQSPPNNIPPLTVFSNTDGPLLPLQSEQQIHSGSCPLSYASTHRDVNSLDATRLNQHHSYRAPFGTISPDTRDHMDLPTSSVLRETNLHPNSTIDNTMLKQIMPTSLPVPRFISQTRQPSSIWSWPRSVCAAASSISSYDKLASQNYTDLVTQHQANASNVNKRKRRLKGPACQRRRAKVIIQRSDDEYYMGNNTHVNLALPKRSRTCDQLGCLKVEKFEEIPQQRMRGRPPKLGSCVPRKGSYKKGRYPCPLCGNFYAWKNYLRIHIAKHEKKKSAMEGTLNSQDMSLLMNGN